MQDPLLTTNRIYICEAGKPQRLHLVFLGTKMDMPQLWTLSDWKLHLFDVILAMLPQTAAYICIQKLFNVFEP